MAEVRLRSPSGSRGPGRVVFDVADGPDVAVAIPDRRHGAPAGSPGDRLRRRRVERVRPEDDDLGILCEEVLERHLVGVRVTRRDRLRAGQRHHLGEERGLRGCIDRAGRVVVADLVEDARLRASICRCCSHGIDLGLHVRRQRGRRVGRAGGGADELDVLVDTVEGGGVDDDHRNVEVAESRDGVGGGEPETTGEHQVGLEGDDLLDVDAREGRDVGQGDSLLRVVAAVVRGDDAIPAPNANRISVVAGVSDTIVAGSEQDLHGRALVVGHGDREGGRR